jgi:spore coat protein U-like protein
MAQYIGQGPHKTWKGRNGGPLSLQTTKGQRASVLAMPAWAGNQTVTMAVGASVPTVCAVVTTTALGFGVYSGVQTTAQGTITLNCTAGGSVTVALNNGAQPNAGQNVMIGSGNAAHTLNYSLYQDGGYSTAWIPASPEVVTGTGASQVLQVYGKMLSGQTLTPDTYSDIVTVSVTY